MKRPAALSKQDSAAGFCMFFIDKKGERFMENLSLWGVYHENIPDFITRLADTPPMQRLRYVGMSCGCEYVALHERDMDLFHRYTRFAHSVGVALIVWHFTRDVKQSVAGLFHDISTPAFAHVVDFLNGDHLTQESTEEKTAAFIDSSAEIQTILRELDLTTADVCDYHRYPIADNDSPRLSADRLEYTCGSFLRYIVTDISQIRRFYEDIAAGTNEHGQRELLFRHRDIAEAFARCSMRCSHVYISDTDRFTMQYLADLLKTAVSQGILTVNDLYTTEESVIERLRSDPRTANGWHDYCSIQGVQSTADKPTDGRYAARINAKRRYIDPYVPDAGRVTAYSEHYREEVAALLSASFENWLSAVE